MAAMIMLFSNTGLAYAAGVETWNPGIVEIGSFTFDNNNTTPAKTINGSHAQIYVRWRKADSDRGLGDVKLTMQIRDTKGNALTEKYVFYYDDPVDGYVTDTISLNVTPGQQIRIWFDASSAGQSNGNYRSIYIKNFWAFID